MTGVGKRITLPKSNIIQFFLEDRSKITVRPSGTEPKIKYYFEVSSDLPNAASFKKVDGILTERIDQLEKAIINII